MKEEIKERTTKSKTAQLYNNTQATHVVIEKLDPPPFIYESAATTLEFKCMTDTYIMRCPTCYVETRYIAAHVSKHIIYQKYIDLDGFNDQFKQQVLQS